MPKFEVGDVVVGNHLANDYGITTEGWVGIVVRVYEGGGDSDIIVEQYMVGGEQFPVSSACFDHYIERDPIKRNSGFKVSSCVG